jgi:sigma-B regulation protein RsbU (phosphoserine phosphatase)
MADIETCSQPLASSVDARPQQAGPTDRRLSDDTAEQLEMAGQVQRNFLPSRLPHTEHLRWAAMFRPAQWVSGDIYDIARLDETHIGFYVTDAVGHSMPAALLTIFLKQATEMRQTIGNHYRIFEPDEVVSNLNQRMAEQEFAGCLFATCCYGLLNIQSLQLRMARAGHPYPILIRGNQPVCLQSRGGLLGVFAEAEFEKQTLQLLPGDKLFVYSDGGEPLVGKTLDDGSFGFNEAFLEMAQLPIEAMIDAYDKMTQNHSFAPGELDDVTAIGLEVLPQ